MPVVVTGAAGFIGRHVVSTLLCGGIDVIGIDRRPWKPAPGEASVVADLASPSWRVGRVLRHADGVVHLAGCPGVRDDHPDIARRRWRDNVLAGEYILEATPADTMVVVASSSSVYGGAGSSQRPRPCHEDDQLHPLGGYARSKSALEDRCAMRADRGGVVGVVRPFTVAGEGQRADMAFSIWIDALRSGRPVKLFGSAARRRDVTDVRDVAEGIVRMFERRITQTVNLGTGVSHRLDDMLAEVARACGVQPVAAVEPALNEDVVTTRADVRRCRELLGFVPVTDLPVLIARQVGVSRAPARDAVSSPGSASTNVRPFAHYQGATP